MQISPDELLAEAGRMALELRLKDRAIADLEQQVTAGAARIVELEQASTPPDHSAEGRSE